MSAWIWDAFHRETPHQLMLFRREVNASSPIASGAIDVAARGSFRVWVDGEPVAHHDVQHPPHAVDAVRVELSDALAGRRSAVIIIGVHLLGIGTHHEPRALGGLWVAGGVLTRGGDAHSLSSSSEWAVLTPTWWRQNTTQQVWSAGYTEWSDRTVGSGTAGDGDGWSAAVEYPDDAVPVLRARDVVESPIELDDVLVESGAIGPLPGTAPTRAAACVALGRERTPRGPGSSSGDSDGAGGGQYRLYTVPHQLVGFLELSITVPTPTTVDVIMGERADDSGWPAATRQGISAIDTVVVPAGTTTHRFWHRRTFRTLAVLAHGTPQLEASARFFSITAARPPVRYGTHDARRAAMHAVSAATVAVGRQDLYEDCPLREGGHYVADARIQALFDLATTGVAATARRSVLAFAAAQDADGMIPALSPSGTRHRIPDFALQWAGYLDEVVRFTGDDRLLAEAYPALTRLMQWAHGRWGDDGFDVDEPGWWTFIDWYGFAADELQAAVDAHYAVALRSAVALAERAGNGDDAALFRARLDAVLARFAAPVRHPHAAAILLCGLDPDEALRRVDRTALDGFRVETGYFAFSVFRARLVLGDTDAAAALLEEYWGGMLDEGAGTWWERCSPRREVVESSEASLCHPWSAGPIVALPMLALGIDPFARRAADAPFTPPPGFADDAARLHTPWGVVVSAAGR